MKLSMTIESDGVVTEVSRDFEASAVEMRDHVNRLVAVHETPPLMEAAVAIARAASTIHRLTN